MNNRSWCLFDNEDIWMQKTAQGLTPVQFLLAIWLTSLVGWQGTVAKGADQGCDGQQILHHCA